MNFLSLNNGIFTVGSSGKVNLDYLYDGGAYKGEMAIFSLQGMENLPLGSTQFLQEAARRALTQSTLGYVAIKDTTDRARFSGSFNWEGNFNSSEYKQSQEFLMQARDTFAMMLVANSTVAKLAANPSNLASQTVFSFGAVNANTGAIATQIVDLTGSGHTFGWEDVNTLNSTDRDFNDAIIQVKGAISQAVAIDSSINPNRDWRNTNVGQEILEYASLPLFEKGTFEVNATGKIQFDYIYDGGFYQGQLAVFSLAGMKQYTPGSVEFVREAAKRALSNSEEGRILIRDHQDKARFTGNLNWENNYNAGTYQDLETVEMRPGDTLAFMLVPNGTVESIYHDPNNLNISDHVPLFSIAEANPGSIQNQIVAVDNKGTLAFEDVPLQNNSSDRDYNDLIFQVRGLTSNLNTIDTQINTNLDWRTNTVGQELLNYAALPSYNTGVFQVGETGRVQIDYLYDGGWF
jgi:hypothetical protein